ncbi:protein kinase domain-containing protein [Streptomyces sp. NPDC054861]
MKVRPWSVRPELRLTAHAVAGRYRLDDLVGRGGAADVYKGLDLRLRRPVAVKVFRPGSDSQTEERFVGEGRLLARMRHPGLVTLYDSGQEDGRPYLVMQLVKGTTLRRRLASSPLTPVASCRLGAALSSALAHVHEAGVVHRDVKPSNILLDRADTPYLTDFGISRIVDTSAVHTATGTLVGTAAYMAPEQVLGKGAGPAADVYSLGLVLLEAVKGELEYPGAPLEAALARLHRPPAIPQDLPADLVELLRAMTDLEETNRPDAHTCLQALEAMPAALGEPAEAPDPVREPEAAGPVRPGAPSAPRDAERPTGSHRKPSVPKRRSAPAASFRSGRALLATGTALAVLGVTLTGSIGGAPTEGRDATSRAPHQAAPDTANTANTASQPTPSSEAPGHRHEARAASVPRSAL